MTDCCIIWCYSYFNVLLIYSVAITIALPLYSGGLTLCPLSQFCQASAFSWIAYINLSELYKFNLRIDLSYLDVLINHTKVHTVLLLRFNKLSSGRVYPLDTNILIPILPFQLLCPIFICVLNYWFSCITITVVYKQLK